MRSRWLAIFAPLVVLVVPVQADAGLGRRVDTEAGSGAYPVVVLGAHPHHVKKIFVTSETTSTNEIDVDYDVVCNDGLKVDQVHSTDYLFGNDRDSLQFPFLRPDGCSIGVSLQLQDGSGPPYPSFNASLYYVRQKR